MSTIEKINDIKCSHHPYSEEIKNAIMLFDKLTNNLLIILNAIGFIIAIVAAVGLSEWADEYSSDVDVPVNFFGYFIEIESDTFAGSPFMVFLYITIIFALISFIIICIKITVIANMHSKVCMLDSFHHNVKLTELLVTEASNTKEEITNENKDIEKTEMQEL